MLVLGDYRTFKHLSKGILSTGVKQWIKTNNKGKKGFNKYKNNINNKMIEL